jgi:hypothetical protein
MKDFIESGILEAYVIGSATPEEEHEVLYMIRRYPEVNSALKALEADIEELARHMAITPPPGAWDKIEQQINELMVRPQILPFKNGFHQQKTNSSDFDKRDQYIQVEAESNFMRVHKTWKWVFAAVFVLGKIFLICAIYFYLENRQAQQQILELKTELKTVKAH